MKILYNKEVNCFEVCEEHKTGTITIDLLELLQLGANKSVHETLDAITAEVKQLIEQESFARSVFLGEEKDSEKAEQCYWEIQAYNKVLKIIKHMEVKE